MLAVGLRALRDRAELEARRTWAFARRNPLTVAGACVGLLVAIFLLARIEGQVNTVQRQQTIVQREVVRISTCAAKPHSTACLRSVTRAVRRCLQDPSCNNLIAGAEIVAIPSPNRRGPRGSSPPASADAGVQPAGPPAPSSTAGAQEEGHGGGHSAGPKSPQPSPGADPGGHGEGHGGAQGGGKTTSEAPQAPPGGDEQGSSDQGGAETPNGASDPPKAGVSACVGELACVEAELGVPELPIGGDETQP